MASYKIQKYKCKMVRDGQLVSSHRTIGGADDASAFFMKSLKGLPHEEMHVVFLSGSNSIIGFEAVARGSQTGMILTTGDVLRSALAINARAIVVGHNHPSGNPAPSSDDIDFSAGLYRACALLASDCSTAWCAALRLRSGCRSSSTKRPSERTSGHVDVRVGTRACTYVRR